jgi:hypothetical protein
MTRSDGATRWGRGAAILLAIVSLWMAAVPARGTLKYGPIEISGAVDSQNLFRASQIDQWQFVQNRNTALIRFDYDWLENGKFIGRYDLPLIKRSKLYLLGRFVYDGFWGIAPGGRQKGVTTLDDLVGGPIIGNVIGTQVVNGRACKPVTDPTCRSTGAVPESGLYSRIQSSGREGKAFDGTLREAYIDLSLRDAPISFRLGRQQVIWGESDQFRMMDIINPLDLTWHYQQEDFEKLRIPLWLVKGIWDMGDLGPITNAFTEVVWNPGDFQPGAVQDFTPSPWAAPIANPLRAGQIQLADPTSAESMLTPIFNMQGTSFRRGDFSRTPWNASDIGVRVHGVTDIPLIHMQGFEFTANYLYARGRSIGAAAGTPFAVEIQKVVVNPNAFLLQDGSIGTYSPSNPFATFAGINSINPAEVSAKIVYPYAHIFGATANWFEGSYTNTVFRLETAYQLGAPFQSAAITDRVPITQPNGASYHDLLAPIGDTRRDIWAGMLGFDRPTWIKFLNPRTTWFITGQFFWSYVAGTFSNLRGGLQTAAETPYYNANQFPNWDANTTNGVGQWDNGPYAGQIERTQTACTGLPGSSCAPHNPSGSPNTLFGNADKVEQWEILTTLAATSFYRGGTVVPFFAIAIDPVNRGFLAQLKCDVFLTNDLIVQPQAKFFNDLGSGRPSLDPWGVGQLARRDEVGLKITYQF